MRKLCFPAMLIVCAVAPVGFAQNQTPSSAIQGAPASEKALQTVVADARKEFRADRSATPARNARLSLQIGATRLLQADRTAKDWVGLVASRGITPEGEAWIAIDIGDNVVLSTWDTKGDDLSSGTLFRPGTPMFPIVQAAKIGQRVLFSAIVLKSVLGSDDAMVNQPKFIVRFSDIKPLG